MNIFLWIPILIIVGLSVFLFVVCYTKTDNVLLHERGHVVEKQYVPDTRNTSVDLGVTSDGKLVTTTHSTGTDQQFLIIFKCDHGVLFSVNHPELYEKLNKDDRVIIDYHEKKNISGEVVGYDFVDAKIDLAVPVVKYVSPDTDQKIWWKNLAN